VANDEIKEQAALYALGALSQLEARSFEAHLRDGCTVCQAELAAFENVVGVIGLDPDEVSPPPGLRNKLMSQISSDPREQKSITPLERTQPTTRVPERQGGFGGMRWFPWAVAASLALVAVVSFLAWQRADERVGSLTTEARQLELAVAARSKEQNEINKVLLTPGATRIDLAGLSGHPSARGVVYVDPQDKKWVVDTDLPPAPAGKEYQLWFLAPGPVSAGMIKTDASGHGFSIVNVPANVGQIAAAAITLEPEGGSQTPTNPIYVLGKTS